MRLVSLFILIFAIVAISGCGSATMQPISSPNGNLALTPSVNQSKADRTRYLCVAFDIHDKTGALLHHVQSGASDFHKWAIGWSDDKTIVLYSSDIGTSAWKLADDGTISKLANLPEDLIDYGAQIKVTKYGE